jgi:hypothetical protein
MKKSQIREIVKEALEESLWDNINAKRKSGRKPARKGSKAYKAAVAAGKKLMELDASTPAPNNIPGGLSQFATIGDLAQMHKISVDEIIRQIIKGTKVESEHTTDLDIAMEIAFDHVYEDPKYYDKLSSIEEMADMRSVEKYADDELDPIDIEFGKHFFDRLVDPRNEREITTSELLDFFARLIGKKDQFIRFIQKYHEFVVKDRKTGINIPFVSQINQAIAKTIMRKPSFMTSNPIIALEGVDDPVKPGILKKRLGKLSCTKVRQERSKLEDKGTHYAKALQRYLNYHCQ